MKFLIDADMPRSCKETLKVLDFEVTDVRDIGLGTASDSRIFKYALRKNYSIITRDLDFANSLVYRPKRTNAIFVLRIPIASRIKQINNALRDFFKSVNVKDLEGTTTIISFDNYRVRRYY